ncbi:hypothetical protein [Intestinibacter sp.]
MMYNIMGFSQDVAYKFGLDLTDLSILRWFVDFKDSNMYYAVIDGEKYYWISYKKLIEDIGILNIGQNAVYKRLQKMCAAKILKRQNVNFGGNYVYYALDKNYAHLVSFQISQKTMKVAEYLADLNCDMDYFYENLFENLDNNAQNLWSLGCEDYYFTKDAEGFSKDFIEEKQNLTERNQSCMNLDINYTNINPNFIDLAPDLTDKSTNSIDLDINPTGINQNHIDLAPNLAEINSNFADLDKNLMNININSHDFNQNSMDINPNLGGESQSASNSSSSFTDKNPSLTDENSEQIINLLNKSNKLISIRETSVDFFQKPKTKKAKNRLRRLRRKKVTNAKFGLLLAT